MNKVKKETNSCNNMAGKKLIGRLEWFCLLEFGEHCKYIFP